MASSTTTIATTNTSTIVIDNKLLRISSSAAPQNIQEQQLLLLQQQQQQQQQQPLSPPPPVIKNTTIINKDSDDIVNSDKNFGDKVDHDDDDSSSTSEQRPRASVTPARRLSIVGGGEDNSSNVLNLALDNFDLIKTFVPPHQHQLQHQFSNLLNQDNSSTSRNFNSLPLFQYVSELSEIGSGQPGMECMPLRQPSGGTYHHHYHHVTDQTKSLQELQNEVGALLEFRDLVIETFPDLKHKMASISATNTLTGLVSNSSLASRREWEPGIRVKRKLIQQKDTPASSSSVSAATNVVGGVGAGGSGSGSNNVEMSSASSLIRSRSNSHSGKKEPKSGEGNGSVVQDSGFSTETSSSKEAHSASSTTGAMQGAVATNRLLPNDSDDELLNLLDVIHRKSNRLRDEVEHLQSLERDNKIIGGSGGGSGVNNSHHHNHNTTDSQTGCINHKQFQEHVDRLNKEDIQLLRKERDRLLDKLAEMEAETLTGRIKATKFHDQVEELITVKKELEEQLKLALSQKLELNSRLHDLNKQYSSSKSSSSQSDSSSHRHYLSSVASTILAAQTSTTTNSADSRTNQQPPLLLPTTFSPVIIDNHNDHHDAAERKTLYPFHSDTTMQLKYEFKNLGRLDGILSAPNRLTKVRGIADSKKITAILLETNVIELQRHLLTLTVQNQVLTQRLEQATKSKLFLNKRLEKSKEDLDDLRFQLEEKDIELEGTKAQLRVLESRTPSKIDFNMAQETNRSSSTLIINRDSSMLHSPVVLTQISTPSMKAMIPLQMDEINQQHSSSTESAQDQTERGLGVNSNGGGGGGSSNSTDGYQTPKRRPPSKIPLPGSKGYLAPKPPTGRQSLSTSTTSASYGMHRSTSSSSGPVSNKSLSRSTGNLYGKSPTSLSHHQNNIHQQNQYSHQHNNRPDSAQSYRKDNSLGMSTTMSRSSSSSIPISSPSSAATTPAATTSSSSFSTINSSNKSTPSPQKFHLNLNNHNSNNNSNTNNNSSPLPIKPKRDLHNVSSRTRHLDSLSRLHATASAATAAAATTTTTTTPTNSTNNLTIFGNNSSNNTNSGGNISGNSFLLNNSNYNNTSSSTNAATNFHRINNSKRDLSSSSFTHGQIRKNLSSASNSVGNSTTNSATGSSTHNVRRVSSASIGRNPIIDLQQQHLHQQQQQQQQQQQTDTDSGKISNIRKMLSIDSYGKLKNTTTTTTTTTTSSNKPQSHQIVQSSKQSKDNVNRNSILRISTFPLSSSTPNSSDFVVKENSLLNSQRRQPPSILNADNAINLVPSTEVFDSNDFEIISTNNNMTTAHHENARALMHKDYSYKQPQLLFEIEMEEQEGDNESDQDKEDFAKFLLNESLLSERNRELEEENFKSPLRLEQYNRVVRTTINNDSECRLIGNVNPNIAKTWQQLHDNTIATSSSRCTERSPSLTNTKSHEVRFPSEQYPLKRSTILSRSISNNSDESEKILFYQPVYENKDNFRVNKVNYTQIIDDASIEENRESVESYFDSIENDVAISDIDVSIFKHDNDNQRLSKHKKLDNEENVNYDLTNIDNIISYTNQEAGEEMADIDSYERRKYIYSNWSLDIDSYV